MRIIMDNNQLKIAGFSLIELLIVMVIVAVLSVVALPVYQTYVGRAKFTEVIQATAPYKIAAEIAWQNTATSLTDLDAGSHGIPDATGSNDREIKSITMVAGVITATANTVVDENNAGVTYVLQAHDFSGGIIWKVDAANSSCKNLGYC